MKYLKIKSKYEFLAKMAHEQYLNINVYGVFSCGEFLSFFIPGAIITTKEFEKMTEKHPKFKIWLGDVCVEYEGEDVVEKAVKTSLSEISMFLSSF